MEAYNNAVINMRGEFAALQSAAPPKTFVDVVELIDQEFVDAMADAMRKLVAAKLTRDGETASWAREIAVEISKELNRVQPGRFRVLRP